MSSGTSGATQPEVRNGLLAALRDAGQEIERLRRETDAALGDRDVVVRAARKSGMSLSQIASALGLTRAGAQSVVKRAQKTAPAALADTSVLG